MYLMYVDESGDPGLKSTISNYFVLSGLIVHENDWLDIFNDFISLRRNFFQQYKLPVRGEIHAGVMINGRMTENYNIQKNDRFMILRKTIDWLASKTNMNIISVIVDKTNFSTAEEVFEYAWKTLIQRFENFLEHKSKETNNNDKGIIVPDNTNGEFLRKLLRKMRRINYIPSKFNTSSRNVPIKFVIEDPFFKESAESYFTQMIDVVSYFSLQYIQPNKYVKKQGAKNYFTRLAPILLKAASPSDQYGRVWVKK